MRTILRSAFFLFLALIAVHFSGCSKKSKKEDITQSLEDRLTDALDFEGGTVKEGDPPKASDSDAAPQISSVESPEQYRLGADFAVELTSDYAEEQKVDKAIIHILGAKKYIVVSPAYLVDGLMVLAGTLRNDPLLLEKAFDVEYALQTSAGLTGRYRPVGFEISRETPQDVESPIIAVSVSNDNTFHESGRPEGSESEDVPQIQEIEAPSQLRRGDAFSVKLYSDFARTEEVVAAILTTPLNDAYYEIRGVLSAAASGWAMTITGHLATEGLEAGDLLVFLYALKTTDGRVGAYRSWAVEVVDEIPDGDEDVDPDPDADPDLPSGPLKMLPARTLPAAIGKEGKQIHVLTVTPFSDGLKQP